MGNAGALFDAIEENDASLVRRCLAGGMDPSGPVNAPESPLHHAVLHHALDSARVLLECGAAVNAVDPEGQSPLHYTCRSGNPESCKLLLAHGADILLEDIYGSTPFRVAAMHRHWEIFAILEESFRHSRNLQGAGFLHRVSAGRSRR